LLFHGWCFRLVCGCFILFLLFLGALFLFFHGLFFFYLGDRLLSVRITLLLFVVLLLAGARCKWWLVGS